MRIVAGCDGGGTKTVVRVQVISDSGAVLVDGRGQAGPGNVSLVASAIGNIHAAVAEALGDAQLESSATIDVMVAALAGAGRRQDQDRARSQLERAFKVSRVEVVPDAAVLFAAADLSGPAIALIVGTGSIAWARDEAGTIYRFGGWGPLLGDEGSGYWIGLEAIKRTVCHLNGHSHELTSGSVEDRDVRLQIDGLAQEVLHHFSVSSLDELLASVYGGDDRRASLAQLAPKVFGQFRTSEIAREIVESASKHLADLIISCTHVAFGQKPPLDVSWICAGSVGVNQEILCELIRRRCIERGVRLSLPTLVKSPVDGALKLAIRLL